MKAVILLIISQITFSCYQGNLNIENKKIENKNIDLIQMNKRFNYENINNFKISILSYVKKNSLNLKESEINNIYDKKDNIVDIINILKLDSHEEYIEKNPNEIYNLITIAILNPNKDKVIFESMQAYLRTAINTLK